MQRIFTHIEAQSDTSLNRLRRLCAQPSVSAQGEGLEATAHLVADMLTEIGCEVTLVPTDGPPVILAQKHVGSAYTLLLYNHYDVQPVDPVDEWLSAPFEPSIRDKKFYARGAADNKGAIVSRIGAIEAYQAQQGQLPVNILWVIEGEEEIGSPHLAQFVDAYTDLLRTADGCVWESGGKNARGKYQIALGCKGLLYVELKARHASHDLHSALAAIVGNPAWRLIWALGAIKTPDERIQIPGFYDAVRPISSAQQRALAHWSYPEDESRALYGIDQFIGGVSGQALKEQLLFHPTCNVDGFQNGYTGPGSKTVLPCEATVKLDFRLVPDQDPEQILALLRAHLDAQGFDDIEIVSSDGEHPFAGDPEHPFVQIAGRVAEQIYGHKPAIIPMMSGTGPVYLLCGQFGVPMITAGVGYAGSNAHAPNEHIRIKDFVAGTKYIAALLEALGER